MAALLPLVAPILAGAGVRLFDNVADALGNYKVTSTATSAKATARGTRSRVRYTSASRPSKN